MKRQWWIFLFVLALVLSGCKVAGKDIVISTGLAKDDLFKIGSEVCPLSEAMIFIIDQKNLYEDAYTSDIWATEVEGDTYEDYLLEQTKNFLAQLKCMKLMAQEKQIVLTSNENERIRKAAQEYYATLTEEDRTSLNLTLETIQLAYEDYYLANKVMEEVTKGVDLEISDDEAKVIRVQQILIKTFATDEQGNQVLFDEDARLERAVVAENVLAQAKAGGTDFLSLARENSDDEVVEFTYFRGQIVEALEKAAFSLEDNEISELIETDSGLYIIKCINAYDIEATRQHKQDMARERKQRKFKEEYDLFTETVVSQFNWELWDSISLSQEYSLKSRSFMEVYDKILKN